MKHYFRKSTKFIIPVLTSIFLLCSTTYFISCYITKHSIVFDAKDGLTFFLFFGATALCAVLTLVSNFRVSKLEKVVIDLVENMVESEENLVEMDRTTQRIVMRLCNRLGDGSDEETK